MPNLILASASPRRREILSGLGIAFTVISADTDESCTLDSPTLYAEELARRKGQAVYAIMNNPTEDTVILSADTVVFIGGEILGKPKDRADAIRMLSLLSGKEHSVVTGIGLTVGGVTHTAHALTRVRVDEIPLREIEKYVDSGDPMDKAGAYGIQGRFSRWIKGIDGCYFNVVGLPVNALNKLYFDLFGEYLG